MRRAIAGATAMALLVSFGCALFQQTVKTFEDMTPKEKALWMMSVYNREYNDYMARAEDPDSLTDAERQVLRLKKVALKKAWPLIKAYNAMVTAGVYAEETQERAFDAVENLLGIGGPDA